MFGIEISSQLLLFVAAIAGAILSALAMAFRCWILGGYSPTFNVGDKEGPLLLCSCIVKNHEILQMVFDYDQTKKPTKAVYVLSSGHELLISIVSSKGAS